MARSKTVYTHVEVDIELDTKDVIDFIEDASKKEIKQIEEAIISRKKDNTSLDDFDEENPIYDFLSLIHREKQLFGQEAMINLLKDEARRIGFLL